jgi:hypothetical protein
MSLRLALALAACAPAWARYEPFDFPNCAASTYFDVSALQCLTCPTGQVPNDVGTSCICAGNTVLLDSACLACPLPDSAPTQDRMGCLPCGNASGVTVLDDYLSGGLVDGECSCPIGKVLVERDGHGGLLDAKQCRDCPVGSYPASATACEPCPAEHMEASGASCACATGYRSFEHPNGWWGRELTCVESTSYNTLDAAGYYDATARRMTYTSFIPSQAVSTITVDESKASAERAPRSSCPPLAPACVSRAFLSRAPSCQS